MFKSLVGHISLLISCLMVGVIAVTASGQGIVQSIRGRYHRREKLVVTGLAQAADNTIPHGLPFTPNRYWFVGQATGTFYESAAADANNFYIHVDAAGPTAINIFVD